MTTMVTELRNRGFTVTVVLGSLRITPASALKADDRKAIRANLGLDRYPFPGRTMGPHRCKSPHECCGRPCRAPWR